jgi:hypothetical protein
VNKRKIAKLVELRSRLRDQESAEAQRTETALLCGEEAHAHAEAASEAYDTDAQDDLQNMRSVSVALLVQEERSRAAVAVARTRAALGAPERGLRGGQGAPLARTKDLRVTELVLERLRLEEAQQELKAEQRLVDDIVAARLGGVS